jgi:hypothetical protein
MRAKLIGQGGRRLAGGLPTGGVRFGAKNTRGLVSCCGHEETSPLKCLGAAKPETSLCRVTGLKLALTERFGQDTFVTVTIRFRFLSRRFQI